MLRRAARPGAPRTGPLPRLAAAGALALLARPATVGAQATVGAPVSLATADSLWDAGRHAPARAAYVALAGDTAATARTVYRAATLLAWDDQLDASLRLYRRYVRLAPGDAAGRLALARTLGWAGRYAEAVALADSVRTLDPGSRDAALDAARTLAWAGRHAQALARYDAWLAAHADDQQAALARARTLAWAGRLGEAERAYAELARGRGDAAALEARKGIARVAGWRGDLARSETLWRGSTRERPDDADAWVGLAQVLRWSGRAAEAQDALRRARAAEPGHADAREQLRWVRAELAPALTPTVEHATDSDRNASTVYAVRAAVPLGATAAGAGLRLQVAGTLRSATFAALRGESRAAHARLRWTPSAAVSADVELGAARTTGTRGDAPAPDRMLPTAAARMSAALPGFGALTLRGGAGATHAPFDETAALIVSGLSTTALDAWVDARLPRGLSASASVSRARVTGGTAANARVGDAQALRWSPRRSVDVAVSRRAFGYDAATGDGYFAPARLTLVEGSAHVARGGDLGWRAEAELALGAQSVTGRAGGAVVRRAAPRGALSLAWRPQPGSEIALAGGVASTAGLGAGALAGRAEYRARTLAVRARVLLP